MKAILLFTMGLLFVYGGCKTTKTVSESKNPAKDTIPISPSQAVKDTLCEELKDHLKRYWSYDENTKLFSYGYKNKHGLMKFLTCFAKMDTTNVINLLGKPSELRDGFMFYYMNIECFEYSQQNCLEYRLDYNTTGHITHIQPQTVQWIK